MEQIEEYLERHLQLAGRLSAFSRLRQYSMEIELTNSCNLDCRYCYTQANSKPEEHAPSFVRLLLSEAARLGIREIGWIGGEPLLYPALFDLMAVSRDLGLANALYTNGILFDEGAARRVAGLIGNRVEDAGRVILHIDSVRYENWAAGQVQPERRNFERVLAAPQRLLDGGLDPARIIVSVPLTRDCYATLEETLEYIAGLGVVFINLIPLTGLGRSADPAAFISREELWQAMEMRAAVLGRPFLIGLGIGEYCKQFQLTDCTITNKGELLPYIDDFHPVGNVYNEPLAVLLEREARRLALADWVTEDSLGNRMDGHCGTCEHARYCFGNPVSRAEYRLGEHDRDCLLNQADP